MKKILFLLALAAAAAFPAHAQTTDSTTDPGFTEAAPKKIVPPTERAARQLTALQKRLNLSQDQVIKLRPILLRLNVALDSLRSNPSGDKKSDNQSRRAITQDADVKTYALLNTDQQVAYTKWKQDQQLKRQMSRAANHTPADSTASPH
jgi:hypothetical protein